ERFVGNPELLERVAAYVPLMEEYYQETTGRQLAGDVFTKIQRFHSDVVQRASQFDFDFSQFEASFAAKPIADRDESYEYEYDFDASTAASSIIAFFQRFRDRVRERQRAGQSVR
ncbi:MAG: hypothetical protein N3E49_09580, partial [Bacteroidia bacterium]|nr:hypothetical protein [Bacteroidia bacterium]